MTRCKFIIAIIIVGAITGAFVEVRVKRLSCVGVGHCTDDYEVTHLVTHLVWPHGVPISMRPRALRTMQDP